MKVPYDNDPRTLKPANKNLKEIPEHCGPNPTQDGPVSTDGKKENDLGYLNISGPEYSYLSPRERP